MALSMDVRLKFKFSLYCIQSSYYTQPTKIIHSSLLIMVRCENRRKLFDFVLTRVIRVDLSVMPVSLYFHLFVIKRTFLMLMLTRFYFKHMDDYEKTQ